jgi:hypothetical protein
LYTWTHLADKLLEVGFPGIELDKLHGWQDLLHDDGALAVVGAVALLVLDDLPAKEVLSRDNDADDSHTCIETIVLSNIHISRWADVSARMDRKRF